MLLCLGNGKVEETGLTHTSFLLKKLQGFTKGAEEVRGRDERKVTWPGKVHGPMGCFVFIWLWIVLL